MIQYLIIAFCVIGLIGIIFFTSKRIEEDTETERKNKELRQTYEALKSCLETTYKKIEIAKEQLKDIQDNVTKTLDNQKALSQEAFESYCGMLEKQYQEKEEEYDMYTDAMQTAYSTLQIQLMRDLDDVKAELDKMRRTRAAAIEAQIKEQQIKDNKDDYRLNISEKALRDIKLLKSVQDSLVNPVVVDKIIWSNYYQPMAKTKFPKILGKATACGIYKLTSLTTGMCYIGQSKDVCDRWKQHCKNALGVGDSSSNKLYTAMREEGLSNFTFELLEECTPAELDEKEKFYISLYSSYDLGLNSTRGNK